MTRRARRSWLRSHGSDTWKGVAAGAVGGLVASYAMNKFSSAIGEIYQSRQEEKTAQEAGKGGEHNYPSRYGEEQQASEDATVKAAKRLSELAGHRLSSKQKKFAGPAVHYLFGAAMGAAYGGLAETEPGVRKVVGLPFGAAVWLGADEIAVPAIKLAKPPFQYTADVHLKALAAHLVYGTTTELVRRGVRAVI